MAYPVLTTPDGRVWDLEAQTVNGVAAVGADLAFVQARRGMWDVRQGVLSRSVNESGILAKLVAAITANDQTLTDMDAIVATVNTFLAITTPSTAQRNAFMADLGRAVRTIATDQKKQTRQLTALARLAVQDLTSTAGT